MEVYHTRHLDILKPKIANITVIGAGGIGSALVMMLAKMGFTGLTVYDFDRIDDVNIGSQWYRISDIGQLKVEALKSLVKDFAGVEINAIPQKTDGKGLQTEVLILAVDSIEARAEIAKNASYEYLIDGRMGGETFSVYNYLGVEKDDYLKDRIFPSEEAVQLPCTAKAICYNTFGIASFLANQVKKINNVEPLKQQQHYCFINEAYDDDQD